MAPISDPQAALYTAAETRELDRLAIETAGIPGIRLMARAAHAAFELLLQQWPTALPVHVFCGTGNNGGDGFLVAVLAHARLLPVTIYQVGDTSKISGDAALARQQALTAGVPVQVCDAQLRLDSGVIVDALLGTGLSGAVRADYRAAIALINDSALPVLAIDIPSGLCSDTGNVLGSAVQAQHTLSFIGRKRGLLTGLAPAYTGTLHFDSLEVPPAVYAQQPANVHCLDIAVQLRRLPARPAHAHKGSFGHVLVVGGDFGMGGAAVLASEAAARCGAGLVSAATRPEHVAALLSRRPEVMAHGVSDGAALDPLLAKASVIAIGPGLGTSPWSEQLLLRVLGTSVALVVDADALNLLAAAQVVDATPRDNWLLTPHPGEAARLLGCSTAEIQADRFAAVRALQARYGGVVVLKGVGSLVCGGGDIFLSPYGNPGMASGGMGDVLSGVLASLLAQGMTPLQAACLGVCVHSRAADLAARESARGLLAGDLLPHLRVLMGS